MRITDILQVQNIFLDITGSSKEDIITQMVHRTSLTAPLRSEPVTIAVLKREEKKSCNYGKGVAIPHAFSRDCEELIISMAILTEPIDWKAEDTTPVKIVLLITGSTRMSNTYVLSILRGAKILANDIVRNQILSAKNVQDIYAIIEKEDIRIEYA